MERRAPEQFLAEEGMTLDTARRIYSNILEFIGTFKHTGCWSSVSTSLPVQEIITKGTDHEGDTSARQFLKDIGEDRYYIGINSTDTEYCDRVNCRIKGGCYLYKNTIEEKYI